MMDQLHDHCNTMTMQQKITMKPEDITAAAAHGAFNAGFGAGVIATATVMYIIMKAIYHVP